MAKCKVLTGSAVEKLSQIKLQPSYNKNLHNSNTISIQQKKQIFNETNAWLDSFYVIQPRNLSVLFYSSRVHVHGWYQMSISHMQAVYRQQLDTWSTRNNNFCIHAAYGS